jgi:alkylhydroperoxidase/carboxymuconolactone decarboxylase family protein YurZ
MNEPSTSWKRQRSSGQWAKLLRQYAPTLHKEWVGTMAAAQRGKVSEKLKHLIWVAVDSVFTHLYPSGAKLHAEEAFANGATIGEVMDTLRIAAMPATRGLKAGYELLETRLQGAAAPQQKSWPELAKRMSPKFKSAWDVFMDGRMPGGLDDRSRCLVALAVSSTPAIADRDGIDRAIEQALKLGVDPDEIVEVMELASLIGSHAFSNILDNLGDELARRSAG